MESFDRYKVLLDHLDWNIRHLKEILQNPKTVYYRDASIQRFGFAFDMAIKCLKTFIEKKKRRCSKVEDCFKAAEEFGWLSGHDDWRLAVKDNQFIKSGFQDAEEDTVYNNLQNHLKFFVNLHKKLNDFLSRDDFNKLMKDNRDKL